MGRGKRRGRGVEGRLVWWVCAASWMVGVAVGATGPERSRFAGDFHVSPRGDDGNPGTWALPFATLERAREAVRERIAAGRDFRLAADSPALRLGFEPIDTSRVGLKADFPERFGG